MKKDENNYGWPQMVYLLYFCYKIGQFLFNLLKLLSPLQLEILDIIFGFKMLSHLKPPLVFLTCWKSVIKELIIWVD